MVDKCRMGCRGRLVAVQVVMNAVCHTTALLWVLVVIQRLSERMANLWRAGGNMKEISLTNVMYEILLSDSIFFCICNLSNGFGIW